jgi:hypothetical protein
MLPVINKTAQDVCASHWAFVTFALVEARGLTDVSIEQRFGWKNLQTIFTLRVMGHQHAPI